MCRRKKTREKRCVLFSPNLSLFSKYIKKKKEEGSRTDNSKRRKKSKRVVPKRKGKTMLLFWSFIYGFLVYFLNPFLRILVFMVFTHGTFKYSSCDDDIYIALPLPLIFSRREGSRRNGATTQSTHKEKTKVLCDHPWESIVQRIDYRKANAKKEKQIRRRDPKRERTLFGILPPDFAWGFGLPL